MSRPIALQAFRAKSYVIRTCQLWDWSVQQSANKLQTQKVGSVVSSRFFWGRVAWHLQKRLRRRLNNIEKKKPRLHFSLLSDVPQTIVVVVSDLVIFDPRIATSGKVTGSQRFTVRILRVMPIWLAENSKLLLYACILVEIKDYESAFDAV